jgi:polyhydroxyalkanoate synthesis regulator phasin
MNSNSFTPEALFQMAQKGFRVGIGASASLIEGLQNPQLYQQNLDRLRRDPNQFLDELAQKGEITEQTARNMVDQLTGNRFGTQPASQMTVNTTAVTVGPDVQAELQDLTAQLAALRSELQQLKNQSPQN